MQQETCLWAEGQPADCQHSALFAEEYTQRLLQHLDKQRRMFEMVDESPLMHNIDGDDDAKSDIEQTDENKHENLPDMDVPTESFVGQLEPRSNVGAGEHRESARDVRVAVSLCECSLWCSVCLHVSFTSLCPHVAV